MNHAYPNQQAEDAKLDCVVGSVASVIDGGFTGFSDSDEEENKIGGFPKRPETPKRPITPKPVIVRADDMYD